jgi:hypothetical protein
VAYNRRCYIPRLLHRLTEEHNLYSSIIELHSLVIDEERILLYYSVGDHNGLAGMALGPSGLLGASLAQTSWAGLSQAGSPF